MLHILLIGENLLLLSATAAALRRSGAEVESSCFIDAPRHLMLSGFDLLVLCSTLTQEKAEAVSRLVKQEWPEMRILQVLSGKRTAKGSVEQREGESLAGHPKLELLTRELAGVAKNYSM